jgi:hypothetical protein
MVSQVKSDRWVRKTDEFYLKYTGAKFSCAFACEFMLLCYVMVRYLAVALYKFDSGFVIRWTTSKLQPVGNTRALRFSHNLYVFSERFA